MVKHIVIAGIVLLIGFIIGFWVHSRMALNDVVRGNPKGFCFADEAQLQAKLLQMAQLQSNAFQNQVAVEVRSALRDELVHCAPGATAGVSDVHLTDEKTLIDNDTSAEVETEKRVTQQKNIEAANTLLQSVLEAKVYTFEDRMELDGLLATIPAEEAMKIERQIGMAINRQELELGIP